MNRIRANKLLGIALGDKSLQVTEVHADDGSPRVAKSAEFPYPEGIALDKPAELGKALAAFLHKEGFSQSHAVIGLPAKWILTRRKDLPPVNALAAAGMLRLAAESDFSADLSDLAIDYIGEPNPAAPTTAFVIATSQEHIAQCQAVAKAARLNLEAVTVTGTSLLSLDESKQSRSLILSLAAVGNELVAHQHGVPTQLRHLALTNGQSVDAVAVVAELRRAMAGSSSDETPGLTVFAEPEFGRAVHLAASEKLAIAPRMAAAEAASSRYDRYAPSAAVAIAALAAKPHVDFLHSRLAPPSTRKSRRPLVWAIAIAVAVVVGVIAAWVNLTSMQNQLDEDRAHLKKIEPEVQIAQIAANRLQTARTWTAGKPRYLACLADLTALFPDAGGTYATNLTLRVDLSGQVTGRAANEQEVLRLLDRTKDAKRFRNVKLGEVREAGRNSREIAFSISFTYQPE